MQQTSYECLVRYMSELSPYLDRMLRQSAKRFQSCGARSVIEVCDTLRYYYLIGYESDLASLAGHCGESTAAMRWHFRWLLFQCMTAWVHRHHCDRRSFYLAETLQRLRIKQVEVA